MNFATLRRESLQTVTVPRRGRGLVGDARGSGCADDGVPLERARQTAGTRRNPLEGALRAVEARGVQSSTTECTDMGTAARRRTVSAEKRIGDHQRGLRRPGRPPPAGSPAAETTPTTRTTSCGSSDRTPGRRRRENCTWARARGHEVRSSNTSLHGFDRSMHHVLRCWRATHDIDNRRATVAHVGAASQAPPGILPAVWPVGGAGLREEAPTVGAPTAVRRSVSHFLEQSAATEEQVSREKREAASTIAEVTTGDRPHDPRVSKCNDKDNGNFLAESTWCRTQLSVSSLPYTDHSRGATPHTVESTACWCPQSALAVLQLSRPNK